MFGRLFLDSREADLPERVRDAIRQQQDQSEVLIGWFQLSVVLLLGGLYLVSPKPDLDFRPVPWALTAYLALTLARLVWAHRTRLPGWALSLSVAADMALLMGLIWSFHLQYEQPPSFYLKAPTLLYVFIFIALRALRFDARFVVLAGILAALGWGVLAFYVVASASPGESMVTRDYVSYLTSNAMLLGAEFDKIISILMVTGILAVALHRARRLLFRAVAEQTAARDLSRFFAPEVAARIKSAEHEIQAGTGEVREAAIVNLDMRGFTRFAADSEAGDVMRLLAAYQAQVVPVLQRHGGAIDKFLGDGILATFGATQPSSTFAADALRAIEEVMVVVAAWRGECEAKNRRCPAVNGAVATGSVLFGAVGDDTRLEYTVIGDAVNLSAKLEKQNKELGVRVLVDARTYDLAVEQGYRVAGEKRRVRGAHVAGVADPIDLVVLVE